VTGAAAGQSAPLPQRPLLTVARFSKKVARGWMQTKQLKSPKKYKPKKKTTQKKKTIFHPHFFINYRFLRSFFFPPRPVFCLLSPYVCHHVA
jgi:hypothetical protein